MQFNETMSNDTELCHTTSSNIGDEEDQTENKVRCSVNKFLSVVSFNYRLTPSTKGKKKEEIVIF